MSLVEYQKQIEKLCFSQEVSKEEFERVVGPLSSWKVYRGLVRNRFEDMIRAGLPRAVDAMGDDEFGRLLSLFFEQAAVQSHFIRDVVPIFVDFLLKEIPSGDLLSRCPWILELAQYEACCWDVTHSPEIEVEIEAFHFEGIVALNETAHLLVFDFPVHQEPENNANTYERAESSVHLCVCRSPGSFAPETWRLSSLAYDLVELWQTKHFTVKDTLANMAEKYGRSVDQTFLEEICEMLAILIENKIVLGVLPP